MTISGTADGAGLPCPEPTKSYWHQDPSDKLLGFRSTSELPDTADVVVVGSGLTGAFAAHFLKYGHAAGAQVLMLEAREACWGATGRVSFAFPRVYSATLRAVYLLLPVEPVVVWLALSAGLAPFSLRPLSYVPILCVPLVICPKGAECGRELAKKYTNFRFKPVLELQNEDILGPNRIGDADELTKRIG